MNWHSFPLPILYDLIQGQLMLVLKRCCDNEVESAASDIYDLILKHKLWSDDIGIDSHALEIFEKNCGATAEKLHAELGRIMNYITRDVRDWLLKTPGGHQE